MATVYVLNKDGKPLMPTTRCGHVRYPPRCAYGGKRKTKRHGGVKRLAQRDAGLLCFR